MADLTFGNREIRDFRNKLTGGGARSNLFEVDIAYPTGLNGNEGSAVNDLAIFFF